MAGFEAFDRDLRLATADLEPEAINAALASFAKEELRKVIASGEGSSTYERYVNGRKGAAEETVQAPGPILYEFTNWPLIVRTALSELAKRAPVKSGRYAAGFVVLAGGMPVKSFADIDPGAEVIIFNVRPYTRKIEVGANGGGRKHFDGARQALNARFRGAFSVQLQFLNMRAGIHPDVPYRLHQAQGRRRGRQSGDVISYPALIINVAD